MNYFNFFDDARKEKKTFNAIKTSLTLFVVALLLLVGIYGALMFTLSAKERRLAYLESAKTDPAFVQQCSRAQEVNDRLIKAESDYVFLRTADWLIDSNSTISSQFVRTVASCFPGGTKIVKMTVADKNVTVEAVAQNLDAMIGVEKRLNDCGAFRYVFIDSAKQDGHAAENGQNAVSFVCKMTLAEKGADEQ